MKQKLKVGEYEHFKGKRYEVLGVGRHSETLEELVVYRALYGKKELWIRSVNNFLEKVRVSGKRISRFKFIGRVV